MGTMQMRNWNYAVWKLAGSESIRKVKGLFGWIMFYEEMIRSILMGQWVMRLGLVW